MQNLKHLYYEIRNLIFNDKQKRRKIEAALPPLSKTSTDWNPILKLIFIELLIGIPSTLLTITYKPSMINKSMVYIFSYLFWEYGYLSYLNECNFRAKGYLPIEMSHAQKSIFI